VTGGPAATLPAPIVCVGFPVLRSSDGTVRALPVPSTLAAAVESAWLDVLDELLDVGPVTVVCLDCHGAPASRAVSLARQLLETCEVMLLTLPGPPLLAAVVVDAAMAALSAGVLAHEDLSRFLRFAAAGTVDAAVVRSVADLEVPGLGLSHHVASYLPGRTPFLVQLSAVQRVDRLKPERVPSDDGLVPMQDGGWAATVMGGGELPPQLVAWLHGRGVPPPVVRPDDGSIGRWWRHSEAVELVLHPADSAGWALHALQSAPTRPRTGCDWCGAPGLDPAGSCEFCGQQAAIA